MCIKGISSASMSTQEKESNLICMKRYGNL